MTIYRDGSRDGVLVTKNDNKNIGFQENNAPKRPKIRGKRITFSKW